MTDHRDILARIDGDLQQATVFDNPYRGTSGLDEYKHGYLNGRVEAFRQFRRIAEEHGEGWTPGYVQPFEYPPQHEAFIQAIADANPGVTIVDPKTGKTVAACGSVRNAE